MKDFPVSTERKRRQAKKEAIRKRRRLEWQATKKSKKESERRK